MTIKLHTLNSTGKNRQILASGMTSACKQWLLHVAAHQVVTCGQGCVSEPGWSQMHSVQLHQPPSALCIGWVATLILHVPVLTVRIWCLNGHVKEALQQIFNSTSDQTSALNVQKTRPDTRWHFTKMVNLAALVNFQVPRSSDVATLLLNSFWVCFHYHNGVNLITLGPKKRG